MALTLGQQLWFVPGNRWRGDARFVVVSKVGRKWAEIERGRDRLDISTLIIDGKGYASPGRCYLTREEYENATRRAELWSELRAFIRDQCTPPAGLSTDAIEGMLRQLGATPPPHRPSASVSGVQGRV